MKLILKFLLLFVITSVVMAQDEVTVPDLTGMNVPAATAALERVGLAMGTETAEGWTEASGIPQNTISTQSVAAGSTAPRGTAINVGVLRSNNVRLLYDDNDLTLINLVDAQLDLNGLIFNATDGNRAAFSRWAGALRERQCLQVWSISRNGPKGLPDCQNMQNWVVTNNRAEHFWTTVSGGATSFTVTVDGITRATCPTAGPGTEAAPVSCEFYINAAGGDDNAEFVYLMYTTERLVVKNPTEDKWYRTNQTTVFNANPNRTALGDSFNMGARQLFGGQDAPFDPRVLAPGQCLLFRAQGASNEPLPDACDVKAVKELPPAELFWLFEFEFTTGDGGKRYKCPAAVAGKRTLCIMPRS